MTAPLEILFEDNHCIAVVKPAPLLTQSANEEVPSLESMVRDYLRERYAKKGRIYLGTPHRLDRPVSGVVVFGRQTKSARRLAEQFQKREVSKRYWAIVEGTVTPATGTWSDWMLKLQEESRTVQAESQTPGARHAIMDYRCLQALDDATLVEFQPQTGRMHQIRVQAAWRGWPVVGDTQYGSQRTFGPAVELPRDRIIALHARSLVFLHPVRYEPIEVVAPLPAVWNTYLSQGEPCE